MKISFHYLGVVAGFLLVLTSFQNCGDFLSPQHDSASVTVSSTEVKIFKTTVFPLTQKCAPCHGAGQNPQFALSDPAATMQFCETTMSVGQYLCNKSAPAQSRWVTKLAGGHNGFGPADSANFQSAIQSWATQFP